jgi:hypothetical protein
MIKRAIQADPRRGVAIRRAKTFAGILLDEAEAETSSVKQRKLLSFEAAIKREILKCERKLIPGRELEAFLQDVMKRRRIMM